MQSSLPSYKSIAILILVALADMRHIGHLTSDKISLREYFLKSSCESATIQIGIGT